MNDFKNQLIELYKQSFDDSDAYIDYFFRCRYREENVAYVERGGRIISALHLIPQKIMIDGKAREAGFISSAATLPEYRGKGVFFETMEKAYEMLRIRGMEFCVLYPFKHEYYKKHGFIEYSYVKRRVAGAVLGVDNRRENILLSAPAKARIDFVEKEKYTVQEYKPGDIKLSGIIKKNYEKVCRNFEGWIIRDDGEWEYRLNEVLADGGIILTIESDNNITGYILANRGRIEECCFTDFVVSGGEPKGGYLIDRVKEAIGMEYYMPLGIKLKDAGRAAGSAPFGMIKKTCCTARETYEFFKDKSCVLFDRY